LDASDKKFLSNILKQPLKLFKFLNNKDINFLNTALKVQTPKELAKFENKNLYNYISTSQLKIMESDGILVKDLVSRIERGIIISSLLIKMQNKSLEMEDEIEKIIIAGLDNAGKTAIIKTFGGEFGIDELTTLEPTKKVDRKQIKTADLNVLIWDFGGQTRYRTEYLKNPGSYFLNVSLLLYVIDVQDYGRFDEAFEYLEAILHALEILEETPLLMIYLHKVDPDISEDPEIKLQIEYLKENLREILLNKDFNYEIHTTSIYSFIASEPKFTSFLKKMVTEKSLIADPNIDKLEEFGKILKSVLNSVIKLSSSVSKQFKEIYSEIDSFNERLANLEDGKRPEHPDHLKPPPTLKPIANFSTKKDQLETKEYSDRKSTRVAVIDELKELFTKVKYKNY